jgi:hypothetical protein
LNNAFSFLVNSYLVFAIYPFLFALIALYF